MINAKAMKLTEEQRTAIIEDATAKLQDVIDRGVDDESDLDFYEDDYGRCYNHGSTTLSGEIEEICIDGLPGISNDDCDIYIVAEYECDCSYHDDYDPGDYWTPPSGGIELDRADGYLTGIQIEVSVYNSETDEYDSIEVSEDDKKYIIEAVNKKVVAYA